jgi:hypothetical protein
MYKDNTKAKQQKRKRFYFLVLRVVVGVRG